MLALLSMLAWFVPHVSLRFIVKRVLSMCLVNCAISRLIHNSNFLHNELLT